MRKLSKKAKRLIIDFSSAAADLTNKAIRPNFIQFGEARAALMDYIAELEGENKKAFDFVKTLRMYCFNANWEYSDPEEADEFDEFDAEVCEYLSEYKERER